jgi:hypothetical protein
MKKSERDRFNRLMPYGVPWHVRIYDNGGETRDRYTVVYSYLGRMGTNQVQDVSVGYPYVAMSDDPLHPQGICQHGCVAERPIDMPTSCHLGMRIPFFNLPEGCRVVVISDYVSLWNLGPAYRELRETAAILAGLRLIQSLPRDHRHELELEGIEDGYALNEIFTCNYHFAPLTNDEIDRLCEKINTSQ